MLQIFFFWHWELQATFKITLDVPSELVALSNMPIVEEKVNGHLKTVSYQESPIMSTYLVAVVVGLFDYVEDCTSDGKIKHYAHCFLWQYNPCS
jgi:puromycin-sensitive aminopeptidase